MNKPTHSLRLPPPNADAFVALDAAPGKTPIPTGTTSSPFAGKAANPLAGKPVSGRKVQPRTDGREMRKQTFYLEADLSRRLAVYCAKTGKDQSAGVAAALSAFLSQEP